jgi:uncharacterized protein YaiI (UPF0178 family)
MTTNQQKAMIWVDADSCPNAVRAAIEKNAVRLALPLTYVANHEIVFSDSTKALIEQHQLNLDMTVTSKQKGSADDYIVTNSAPGDIVITRDIPLAQRLLQKKVTVINDRGLKFDEKNIVRMLKDRELSMQLSAIGVNMGRKNDTFGSKELAAFNECLDKVLGEEKLI